MLFVSLWCLIVVILFSNFVFCLICSADVNFGEYISASVYYKCEGVFDPNVRERVWDIALPLLKHTRLCTHAHAQIVFMINIGSICFGFCFF